MQTLLSLPYLTSFLSLSLSITIPISSHLSSLLLSVCHALPHTTLNRTLLAWPARHIPPSLPLCVPCPFYSTTPHLHSHYLPTTYIAVRVGTWPPLCLPPPDLCDYTFPHSHPPFVLRGRRKLFTTLPGWRLTDFLHIVLDFLLPAAAFLPHAYLPLPPILCWENTLFYLSHAFLHYHLTTHALFSLPWVDQTDSLLHAMPVSPFCLLPSTLFSVMFPSFLYTPWHHTQSIPFHLLHPCPHVPTLSIMYLVLCLSAFDFLPSALPHLHFPLWLPQVRSGLWDMDGVGGGVVWCVYLEGKDIKMAHHNNNNNGLCMGLSWDWLVQFSSVKAVFLFCSLLFLHTPAHCTPQKWQADFLWEFCFPGMPPIISLISCISPMKNGSNKNNIYVCMLKKRTLSWKMLTKRKQKAENMLFL